MSILFGLLLARRFYCRSALSLSPGRTGGLLPRINAPKSGSSECKMSELPFYFFVILLNTGGKICRTHCIRVQRT